MERFRRIFEEEFERGKQDAKHVIEETPDSWLVSHGQIHSFFEDFSPTSQDFKEVYFEREPEARAFARSLGIFFERRQFLHHSLIAPSGMGKTYFVAGLCLALREKLPGSAQFWNIVDTPTDVLTGKEDEGWFELREVQEAAFCALIMPSTGPGLSEVIRICRQERKFLLTIWTPPEYRLVDKVAFGIAREFTLTKLTRPDLFQIMRKRIEYCGLSSVFPQDAIEPLINACRGNPWTLKEILHEIFLREIYPLDLPALTPDISMKFLGKVDFEKIFILDLKEKDLQFLTALLREGECELVHLANILDWTYNQTWRRTTRLMDLKIIQPNNETRKLHIHVNPLIQTWVEEKIMHW